MMLDGDTIHRTDTNKEGRGTLVPRIGRAKGRGEKRSIAAPAGLRTARLFPRPSGFLDKWEGHLPKFFGLRGSRLPSHLLSPIFLFRKSLRQTWSTSMSFLQREHDRLMELCIDPSGTGREYDALYAAKQALAWALDPDAVASPSAQIARHYNLDVTGTKGTGVLTGKIGPDAAMSPQSPN
jgi:hypothetical protein